VINFAFYPSVPSVGVARFAFLMLYTYIYKELLGCVDQRWDEKRSSTFETDHHFAGSQEPIGDVTLCSSSSGGAFFPNVGCKIPTTDYR
jgi:hypothetical protein